MALPEFDASQQSSPTGVPAMPTTPIATSVARPEPKSRTVSRLVLGTVLFLSALYGAKELKRGWFPWDDGVLAQSADSVLRGELPHADYVEIYTGGLSYLNALSFRIFGINLASMRYMLLLFFLLWVPAFYYAARRFVSDLASGAVTLLAVAWSIPNYSAAMPSWYNLFFATFGLAALLYYIEIQNTRWLFIAGLCGGISVLFKISGLYFVAGGLLFLLFRETVCGTKIRSRAETTLYKISLSLSILLFEIITFLVLRKVSNAATFFYFWLPNLAIGAVILASEFSGSVQKGHRFSALLSKGITFLLGVALPITVFLSRYVVTGTIHQLFGGVAGSIAEHIQYVNATPSVMKLAVGLSLNIVFWGVTLFAGSRIVNLVGVLLFVGTPVALFLVRVHPFADRAVWGTMWSLLPFVVVAGAGSLIFWRRQRSLDIFEQQKLFLVLAVCATTSLIQFPFTAASYYCYVAPFAFLSASALLSQFQARPKLSVAAALCFCLLYMVFDVTPGFVMNMGQQYIPDNQTAKLEGPRAGGIRVEPKFARAYGKLSTVIAEHAHGEYIYAIPNSPEVYFLNGLRDPTSSLFRTNIDPSRQVQTILNVLRLHDVNLVVFNSYVPFMQTISPGLRAALEREFPNREIADQFEVRWKR